MVNEKISEILKETIKTMGMDAEYNGKTVRLLCAQSRAVSYEGTDLGVITRDIFAYGIIEDFEGLKVRDQIKIGDETYLIKDHIDLYGVKRIELERG